MYHTEVPFGTEKDLECVGLHTRPDTDIGHHIQHSVKGPLVGGKVQRSGDWMRPMEDGKVVMLNRGNWVSQNQPGNPRRTSIPFGTDKDI